MPHHTRESNAMASTSNSKKRLKAGAVGAAAALLLAGGVGYNYLQSQDDQDAADGQNQASEGTTTPNGNPDTYVPQDPKPDSNNNLDPSGDNGEGGNGGSNGGDSNEQIIVNPDGTTGVSTSDSDASGSDQSDPSINPGTVTPPEDKPDDRETNPSPGEDGGTIIDPENPGGGEEPGGGTDPENPGGGTDPENPGGGTDPENPGGGEEPGGGTDPTDQDVNIQELIDYINFQRNLYDANRDGGLFNDGVSTGSAPSSDLYAHTGGALVVVDDDGRPVGVIWSDMSQADRDALLSDLSRYDETRIYGVNRGDDTASITIDQYVLRNTEARDDSVSVQQGGSVTIQAEQILANDRVLVDEGGLFGGSGASNITSVSSDFEGITWNPSTGEITVDTTKYRGDGNTITFDYTIQHDQDADRNKSGNTSTSTGTVTVTITPPAADSSEPEMPLVSASSRDGYTVFRYGAFDPPAAEPEASISTEETDSTPSGRHAAVNEDGTPAYADADAEAEAEVEASASGGVDLADESVTEPADAPIADSYEEPTSEEPAYDATLVEEPAAEEPSYDEPVYEEPLVEEPAYDDEGTTDTAPAEEAAEPALPVEPSLPEA